MKLYNISFIEQPYEKYLEWVETFEKRLPYRGEKHIEFVRFLHDEKMALVRLSEHAFCVLYLFRPRPENADRDSSTWKTEFASACDLMALPEAEFLSDVGDEGTVVIRMRGGGRHWPDEEGKQQVGLSEIDGRLWGSLNPESHSVITKIDFYKIFSSGRSITQEEAMALVTEAEAK